jgi:hypothetical protein
MPLASTEAYLALAFSGLLLVVLGEVERGAAWSPWLAPIGLVCVLAALSLGLRAATRAGRQRIAVVGLLAGGAALHEAQFKMTEIGGAVVLAASTTVAWHNRTRRRRGPAADYRVTDALLRERFASLGEGATAERWRAFLAQREPGDELWYVHEAPTDPAERGGAEFLVLLRPGGADEPADSDPSRAGREIARFPTRRR